MQMSNRTFSSLMSEFGQLMGQFVEADSEGFEFESEGVTVRLMPHPSNPELGLLESDVQTLSAAEQGDARLLRMLHQLNETSSWATGWLVVVDLEGQLLIRRMLALEGVSAQDLQGHLLEAIDRARALQHLLVDMVATGPSSLAPVAFDPSMQRV